MSEPVLVTRDLKRSFVQGDVTIEVLRGVDLAVQPGEIVALLGPSGSGKSTLLQAVGLLEGGFEGSIRLKGEEAASLDDEGRTRLRRDLLGFVYQFHHLLPEFNAVENVTLPQLVSGCVGVNTTMRPRYEPAFGRAVERVSGKNARAGRRARRHVLRTNSAPLRQFAHSYGGVIDVGTPRQSVYLICGSRRRVS